MKYLGIDFGTQKIGVALSDDGGTLTFPEATIANTPRAGREILEIVRARAVQAIVLGESKDYSGKDNKIMDEARSFAEIFRRENLPVYFHPEILTTAEARHALGSSSLDSKAAAIMLQSFLDAQVRSEVR